MSEIIAYLDSNVVIEFCWDEFITRDAVPIKKTSYRLFENAAAGEFEATISEFTILEVSQHFANYFLLLKLLKSGYSYNEFKRERKLFSLEESEVKDIAEISEFLRNNGGLNFIEIEKLEGIFFKEILQKYTKSCVEIMDALHVETAIQAECTHFITKDGELRKRLDEMKQQNLIASTFRIATPNGFLTNLRKGD